MDSYLMNRSDSLLLVIDIQDRLMPAIAVGDDVVLNANRLIEAARLLSVPAVVTEQNPEKLGATVSQLDISGLPLVKKMTFDSCPAAGFNDALSGDKSLIVIGCEAHVCVLQTVMGLLARNRKVFVVEDAVGSRTADNKQAALSRMARQGAEIVTTEMVAFEWLASAEDPDFKKVISLIK